MRYIQASISDSNHREFTKFAFNHEPQLTLNELIEMSIKKYIEQSKVVQPTTLNEGEKTYG